MLGNSIRLRLSQTEVKQILNEGEVKQTVKFSKDAQTHLHYTLKKTDVNEISASFDNNEICVYLPIAIANEWADSLQVSLENHVPIKDDEQLKILVEKDFQCLDEKRDEDESDLFPNPGEVHKNC